MRYSDGDLAQLLATTQVRVLHDRHPPPLDVHTPEAMLLAKIRALAKVQGFRCYHTHRSDHSESGFPDVVLAKPGRLVFAELKSARGKPSEAQQTWLDLLRHSIPDVEVYLWKPADWPAIHTILTRRSV